MDEGRHGVGASPSGDSGAASGVGCSVAAVGMEVKDDEEQPKEMAEFQQAIKPRGQQVFFFGALDHHNLAFTERMIVKTVRAPEGIFGIGKLLRIGPRVLLANLA